MATVGVVAALYLGGQLLYRLRDIVILIALSGFISRTTRISPLLVLVSVLAGYSIGNWIGGLFGGFAAGLLAIPVAGAIQIIGRHAGRNIDRQEKARINEIDWDVKRDSGVDRRLAAPANQADAA